MGKTRARQQTLGDGSYALDENRQWSDLVLNLQVCHSNLQHTLLYKIAQSDIP